MGASTSTPVRPAPRRLAVLPLDRLGPGGDDYFVDGMTEELITTLSRLPQLRVIARTSAMHYKGTTRTIAEIAQELGVSAVLEGSVRASGKQLRVAVRLVDAQSQEDLWSESYDRRLTEAFAVQREISLRVARALRIRLGRSSAVADTSSTNPEPNAHDLYLRGRFQWNLRSEAGLREAVHLFEEAVGKDPSYALAFSGLADAWAQIGWLEYSAPTEAFPKARQAAEAALALDDRLAQAHASLGFVRFLYERDWPGADRELRRSIELNPGYPGGHQFYADYLKALGRFDEAMAEMRVALELDPLSMAVNTGFGHVLYLARDYDAAIEQYARAIRIDPSFGPAHLWFGRPYLQKGRFDEAIAEIQLAVDSSGGSTISLAVLAHAYASAGRGADARAILGQLMERAKTRYLPSYWIALIYCGLGEVDQAISWLERAYEERSSWLVWIKVEPRFDRLRSDPRFASLLTRMHLDRAGLPTPSRVLEPRRLAAIMFTDVVGFTRLAQADEASALALLEEHRALVRPLFSARGGREVKTLGDGFMVEFPSAVESVRCGLEVQSALLRWNDRRPAKDRLELRIGIHLGDVVSEGTDLVGDGVNVASRIEPMAEPGGLCVSGAVWDQVRNKVPAVAERVEGASLKNVSAPIEVFRIRPTGVRPAVPGTPVKPSASPHGDRRVRRRTPR